MKAYPLKGIHDLRYTEVALPELKSGWCLVQVKAAGICSSDIPRIFTKGTYHFPTIPGHEFSGIVTAVADEENTHWVGKAVGVFPLIPCQKCPQCKEHRYEMCADYDYIGSRRDGAFAEYVAVPVWNLVALTDSISFPEAAMLEPVAVALHAIKRAGIQKGNAVAIIGTGMIGFAAAQWAKTFGATVSVIGRNEQKRALAEKFSDLRYVNQSVEAVGEYDVVIEAVGTPSAINQAIEITAPGGRVVFMGNPSGDITLSQAVFWRILRKQLTVTGTWNSAYEPSGYSDWQEACQSIANKAIEILPLISHTYPQEELEKALMLMKNQEEPYCKVMTLWNQT